MNGSPSPALNVDENRNSFTIGTLSAIDEDVDDLFKFFLTDSAAGKFIMDGHFLKASNEFLETPKEQNYKFL